MLQPTILGDETGAGANVHVEYIEPTGVPVLLGARPT